MSNLKGITDGEYENNADLIGIINTEGVDELLGRISRLPKAQQAQAFNQLIKKAPVPVSGSDNSRREFERKFMQLPQDIREGLKNKRLQLADTRFYIVKDIGGKSGIDIFQGTDNKNVGLGNIANQKLEKDNWFILSAIIMLYATAEYKTKETAEYTLIPSIIRNGEMELEAGNKKLIGLTDNSIFDTRNRNNVPMGYYKLESTKIIEPQVEIKMPVKFAAAAEMGTSLRVIFIGTSVIPF